MSEGSDTPAEGIFGVLSALAWIIFLVGVWAVLQWAVLQ